MICKYVVEEVRNRAQNQLNNLNKLSKVISNVQIENAIENIEDNDLNDNFVGVFPSNRMSKFINRCIQ